MIYNGSDNLWICIKNEKRKKNSINGEKLSSIKLIEENELMREF